MGLQSFFTKSLIVLSATQLWPSMSQSRSDETIADQMELQDTVPGSLNYKLNNKEKKLIETIAREEIKEAGNPHAPVFEYSPHIRHNAEIGFNTNDPMNSPLHVAINPVEMDFYLHKGGADAIRGLFAHEGAHPEAYMVVMQEGITDPLELSRRMETVADSLAARNNRDEVVAFLNTTKAAFIEREWVYTESSLNLMPKDYDFMTITGDDVIIDVKRLQNHPQFMQRYAPDNDTEHAAANSISKRLDALRDGGKTADRIIIPKQDMVEEMAEHIAENTARKIDPHHPTPNQRIQKITEGFER